ncbi:MAG: SDR family oxidoreductase [Fimbriimonadaceae bacterium]|nr:SDR family oxidoreductase [Fimbriimonadaceae bacterium]
MLLAGRVAVVTGGGRGIGACISRTLATHGATVAVVYSKSGEKAAQVVADITAAGGTASAFEADVRDAAAVATMAAAVVAKYGRLDALVNNAIAGDQSKSFADATWDHYQNMVDFGCRAVYNTIKACQPHFAAAGGGRVVNIVTELWNMAPANWSCYLAGKGAMVGMSRSLAMELGPQGITVNMVAPGWMQDEKVDPSSEGSQRFGKTLPVGFHGSADEIGNGCVFFLSDLARYVTGAYLPVTGGRITQMGA